MTTTEINPNGVGTHDEHQDQKSKPKRPRPQSNPHAAAGKRWADANKRVEDLTAQLAEARTERAEALKAIQESSK